MTENLSLVKKITLLALPALLAGTDAGVFYSLIFAFSLTLIAFIIKMIAPYFKRLLKDEKAVQIGLWGLGFSLSLFLAAVLSGIFSSSTYSFNFYFILIGVNPLIYADLDESKSRYFIVNHTMFFDLMLAVSILREVLGRASIFDYQLFNSAPLPLAASPAGAFLILAVCVFIYEWFFKKFKVEEKILGEFDSDRKGGLRP